MSEKIRSIFMQNLTPESFIMEDKILAEFLVTTYEILRKGHLMPELNSVVLLGKILVAYERAGLLMQDLLHAEEINFLQELYTIYYYMDEDGSFRQGKKLLFTSKNQLH